MATSTSTSIEPRVAAPAGQGYAGSRHPLWVAGSFVLLLALFWPTIQSLALTWNRFDYAHGWLVPPLVAWLFWDHREALREGWRGGDALLLLPVVGLSLFWLTAMVTHVQLFHQAAFALLLTAWGLFVFGRRAARTVLAASALVLLSLPIWDAVAPVLKRITAIMSWLMVRVVGVPAELDGYYVHLPAGTFEVGDDCAGLNYLLAALAISLVYSQVLLRDRRKRFLTIGLAGVIALVGNWLRVAGLVVVGHLSDMQAWLVDNHIEYGFVIFGFGLLLFFYLMQRLDAPATGPEGAQETDQVGAHEADATTPGGRWKRAAAATALAALGPVFFYAVAILPAADVQYASLADIASGSEWEVATGEPAFGWAPHYPGAQRHDRLWFTDGTRLVAADRFVYREQSPKAKLIGWPNRLAYGRDILDQRVVRHADGTDRRLLRQAVVSTEDGPLLVWYWYRVGGRDTFTALHAKALEIPAFLQRRRSAELIAFSSLCGPDDCAQAYEALSGLVPIDPPVVAAGP